MDLPVKLNQKNKSATVVFAHGDDFAFLEEWREKLGKNQHPHRMDAVEFAQLAQFRYSAHSAIQPYAQAIGEFEEYSSDNPFCEVACLVFLRCDWFSDCDIIGLSHFRRTWSNRIILDYLSTHPFIAKPPPSYPEEVNGVGTALLYFVTQVAKTCGSDLIWGEATQNSCGFYKRAFRLASVRDLIYVPRVKFIEFSDRLDSSWAKKLQSNPVLDEIYKIEAENPPFVGSKTAVFSPPRKLVQHFLELHLHRKMEVAQALGAPEDRNKIPRDPELFRRIFQHAAEQGKLPSLWREIETRHPDGEPDENPFEEPQ